MKRTGILFIVLSLLLVVTALAEDNSTTISGFVDASYSGTIAKSSDTFGLDQVELDIARCINENAYLRADLEWVNDGAGGSSVDFEQGFLQYSFPNLEMLTFTLGKFNAPIGFELLDAPDMYQFSHSLLFDYGLPTNLTGLMCSAPLGMGLDLSVYAVNGWDQNTDINGTKTFGGRLGFMDEHFGGFGVSYISGVDDTSQTTVKSVLDVDVTCTLIENLLIGAEYNMGTIDDGTNDYGWSGFMVMSHYDFMDWMGLTLRYDMFMDSDTYIFEVKNDEGVDLFNSAGQPLFSEQTRSSFTLAPTFVLGEGLGALIEYRMDMSSEDVFTDNTGKSEASTSMIAFEMTYTF
ncbi:porin [bacterium]|nr:porin [bacterium]